MKIINILIILCAITLSACSSTERFIVTAPSGTTIYTPNKKTVPAAQISTNETAKIAVPSNIYCGYLIIKSPDYDFDIPIGTNYKINRHLKPLIISSALTFGGAGAMGGFLVAGSMPGTIIGLSTWVCSMPFFISQGLRFTQMSYQYCYGYERQNINIPQLSTTLLNPNPPKVLVQNIETKSVRKKASSGENIVATQSSSKANKSRSDLSKQIAGTYSGNGTLLLGSGTDEHYPTIAVILTRKDKNHVSVRVVENGEDYFDSELIYTVKSNKDGSYSLAIDNLPEATITITQDGILTFKHSKVNIDNQLYILSIKAMRQD